MSIDRREFIRRFSAIAGCFVATASVGVLPGCSRSKTGSGRTVLEGSSQRYSFEQGIASADPHPDAVVLWTRVIDSESNAAVPLVAQIALTSEFDEVVLETDVASEPTLDHTLRLFAQGLDPATWYWYRFVTPDGFASRVGRTYTAPAADSEDSLELAMFSCQSYESGFFNSYRRLVVDDAARSPAEQTKMCVHVGDWYYENIGGTFSPASDVETHPFNRDGSPRSNQDVPSGGAGRGRRKYAHTVEDFRFIQQNNLRDEALLQARALYPFVYIWDDHEVRNDYWQGYDNAGPAQTNKLAANQAWFEYCPAALSRAAAGPAGFNPARDFVATTVENAAATEFDDNFLSLEENNLKAIGSMTIYRTLSWGKTADLVLVDGRSYRGKRGVDDAIMGEEVVAYPSAPIDPEIVDVLSAGRTANGGNPPDTITFQGREVANPRKDAPMTSMLGGPQKEWFKQTLANSNARWKVLCNNVPMMRFGFDSTFTEFGVPNGIYFSDSWDGYPTERNELMKFIVDEEISNVISLTGDRHAHYAGLVYDDYQAESPFPVMAELVGAGVSAACRQQLQTRLAGDDPFFAEVAIASAESIDYIYNDLPALNGWMMFGADAAMHFNATLDEEGARAKANPDVNPHLFYADNDAYGFFRVVIDQDKCAAEFVVEPQPMVDHTTDDDPPVRRRVRVKIPAIEAGEPARLGDVSVSGEALLMGLKNG